MAKTELNIPNFYDPALFKTWGNYLERRTVQAFKQETSPAGQPWTPLRPKTIERKLKRKTPKSRNKILRDTGALYDSINTKILPDGIEFGTNIKVGKYSLGAIHQYGAPRRNIPPRPFLPLDATGRLLPQDEAEIKRITEKFIHAKLNR